MNRRTWLALIVLMAPLSGLAYLGLGGGVSGFPLDDAWIHQTYARNIALVGRWSYDAQNLSAGSTSPLWTLALALGYALGVAPLYWTCLLGLVVAGWLTWLVAEVTARLLPGRGAAPLLAAACCAFEWHLVWASLSGMETLLFAALGLLTVQRYLSWESGERIGGLHGLATGLCAGLLVLTRPDGLLVLACIGAAFVVCRIAGGIRPGTAKWAGAAASGALVLIILYVLLNLHTSGFVFPATFYAKQAEYEPMIRNLSLADRMASLLLPLMAGLGVVLAPGFLAAFFYGLRLRNVPAMLLWFWVAASWLLYALRLPVNYQHGRYLMPTLPAYLILSVAGAWWMLGNRGGHEAAARVVSRVWIVAAAATAISFWWIGARVFWTDVAFINGEMGQTATWLKSNVPPDARIAAHDIGMVGYELNRPLIDLAGLITPEVIPFINDETRLLDFMRSREIDYVVVFPDWSPSYRRMVEDQRLEAVHDSGFAWARRQDRENMTVYQAAWLDSD